MLDGEVEIDGAYFGGHVRPKNKREDRVDRRLFENKNPSRRVVIGLRERKGRTLTFVRKSEADGVGIALDRVSQDSIIYADEARHWDVLEYHYDNVGRINHDQAYSMLDGTHTNGIESFWSRLRRMIQGQHHHVSHKYLFQYANHAAWMEDHRERSNGDNAFALLGASLKHPVSREWKGYWQRRKKAA
jgi:transposase-like protein